jgi:hypothetical protein
MEGQPMVCRSQSPPPSLDELFDVIQVRLESAATQICNLPPGCSLPQAAEAMRHAYAATRDAAATLKLLCEAVSLDDLPGG